MACSGTLQPALKIWTLPTTLPSSPIKHQGMQANVTWLPKISVKMGLGISKSKTKVMRVKTRNMDNIKLDGEAIILMKWKLYIPWQQHQQGWWV